MIRNLPNNQLKFLNYEKVGFEDIPVELAVRIISFVEGSDIAQLRLVSKKMHDFVTVHLQITWNKLKYQNINENLFSYITEQEKTWDSYRIKDNTYLNDYMDGFSVLNTLSVNKKTIKICNLYGISAKERILLTVNAFFQLLKLNQTMEDEVAHADCMLWQKVRDEAKKKSHQPLFSGVPNGAICDLKTIQSILENTYVNHEYHTILKIAATNVNLRQKNISCLSNRLANFENIKELNLSDNNLIGIPSAILKLRNLEKLYASNNQIRKLPEGISKLNRLKVLSLHSNKIYEVNNSITDIKNLTHLYLANNPIKKMGNRFKFFIKGIHFTYYTFVTSTSDFYKQLGGVQGDPLLCISSNCTRAKMDAKLSYIKKINNGYIENPRKGHKYYFGPGDHYNMKQFRLIDKQ